MMREKFAKDFSQRSLSKCAEWLYSHLEPGSPSPLGPAVRKDVNALLSREGAGRTQSAYGMSAKRGILRRLAAEYLRESCVGQTTHVDDFPAAADSVLAAQSVASNPNRILSDAVLRELLDHFPGGVEFFESHGASKIRSYLEADPDGRFNRTLGSPELRRFLSDDKITATYLERADAILSNPQYWLQMFVIPAITEAMTDAAKGEYSACVQRLLKVERLAVPPGPLVMPSRANMRAAVVAYVDTHRAAMPDVVCEDADALVQTLDPARWVTRKKYQGDTAELRALLEDHLREASGLPLHGDHKGDNMTKLVALLGGTPSREALSCYPDLASQVDKCDCTRTPTPKRATPPRTIRGLGSPTQVVAFLQRHVDAEGALPNKAALGDRLEAIEHVMNSTYKELTERLHERRQMPLPSRSSNEVYLDALIRDGFDGRVVDMRTEWSEPGLFSGSHRADTYTTLKPGTLGAHGDTVEVLWEADGEGHFTEVRNWDLERQRRNDSDKAASVARVRREDGRQIMHVAVHHRALTENGDPLDAEMLARIVRTGHEDSHWWLFIRPRGCTEVRSAPDEPAVISGPWEDAGLEVLALTDDVGFRQLRLCDVA